MPDTVFLLKYDQEQGLILVPFPKGKKKKKTLAQESQESIMKLSGKVDLDD